MDDFFDFSSWSILCWIIFSIIIALLVVLIVGIVKQHRMTLKESCQIDCHDKWSGVTNWACVESCLKIKD